MSGKFVGRNVEDMLLAYTAATAAGLHVCVIGSKGRGKTTASVKFCNEVFGKQTQIDPATGDCDKGEWVFLRFDPTTEPEKVKGYVDMKALLDPNDGKMKILIDGTAYDADAKGFVFDEWWRAMNAVFDIGIDVFDRVAKHIDDPNFDWTLSPTVIATANFVSKDERTDAVRNRFGLTVWLEEEVLDPHELTKSKGDQKRSKKFAPDFGCTLPSWDDFLAARRAIPGLHADAAIDDVISTLVDEANKYAENDGFEFDWEPRTHSHWYDILFHMTVLRTGDPDFTVCHPDAIAALKWAWASKDDKEAAAWKEICSAIADPMESAINNLFTTAHEKMRQVTGDIVTKARALGLILDEGKQNLVQLAQSRGLVDVATGEPTDPRIREAEQNLAQAMADILRS